MRQLLVLVAPIALMACGAPPSASTKAVSKPMAKAPGKPSGRRCPDPDLIEPKDPCSIAYLPPYKPTFKRDKF